MLAQIKDLLTSALEELEGDDAEEITFDLVSVTAGTRDTLSVPVIPNMLSEENPLLPGGFESEIRHHLTIRIGHFITADNTEITVDSDLFTADNMSPRPRPNKLCSFRGKRYRVLSVAEDGTRAYLRVALVDLNRR